MHSTNRKEEQCIKSKVITMCGYNYCMLSSFVSLLYLGYPLTYFSVQTLYLTVT